MTNPTLRACLTAKAAEVKPILEAAVYESAQAKWATENGNRSNTTINYIHAGVKEVYQPLLACHPLFPRIHLKSEHECKVRLPYQGGKVKNIDLGLKSLDTKSFIDAFFIKSPLNNYSQNKNNYEENMSGAFLKAREVHSNLRIVFFDFLPMQDIYFDGQGVKQRCKPLRTPTPSLSFGPHSALYALATYEYHPDLLALDNKSEWPAKWMELESKGQQCLLNINVDAIMDMLIELVMDLEVALIDSHLPACTTSERFSKNLTDVFNAYYAQNDQIFNLRVGGTMALLNGYSLRSITFLKKECQLAWTNMSVVEFEVLWMRVKATAQL